MISIETNANALMAQAATASVQIDAETAMQRLSSGKRINAAKDDAAGVAIASRMTSHVKGLHQSIRNSMDAQALVSTAEGGLQETEVLLQRIRELAVQASNDTNSDADRTNLNNEAQQLLEGIDAIASGTTWAGQNLLDGTYSNKSFQVGGGSMAADQVMTSLQSSTAIELGLGATSSTSVVTTTTQEPTTTYSTNDVDTPVAYTELAVRNTSENTPSTRYVSTDYLENGNVISVWESSNANNSGTTLKANISDSSNSSVTAEFEIISSSQGSNTTPSVKALRNGGFIVTWNEQLEGDVNGLVSTIKARIFDSVGNATTGDLLISDGVNGINLTNSNRNYKNPSVIELNNGNLVIGFEGVIDLRTGDNNWGVGAKIITSTGTSVKDQFKIHSATNNGQHDLKLAALSTGGFSAAYKSSATYSSWQVVARVFSADGQPTTSETAIHSGAQRFVYGSAPAENGNTIFLYKFNGELMAKKYNAQMVAQSLETAVMSSFQNNGSITKMDDGTYIVVGANSSGYFAQRLNDDLSKVGEILTINNSAPTNGMIEISANSETEFTGI
ncbi:hypothetical protein N9Y85_07840, partial [Paracoccaceae bacterium]|nr:hypothetical protein [Paracoccaceae bacterium]